jgi:hypothetical protein
LHSAWEVFGFEGEGGSPRRFELGWMGWQRFGFHICVCGNPNPKANHVCSTVDERWAGRDAVSTPSCNGDRVAPCRRCAAVCPCATSPAGVLPWRHSRIVLSPRGHAPLCHIVGGCPGSAAAALVGIASLVYVRGSGCSSCASREEYDLGTVRAAGSQRRAREIQAMRGAIGEPAAHMRCRACALPCRTCRCGCGP